jgi:branched-chain amino acid transport system permease protein
MLAYSNQELLQRIFDGLADGSTYALVALGLVIIYRGTGHLNFAQGEMGLFCAYCYFQFNEWGWGNWDFLIDWQLPITLLLAVTVGFALGSATEVALVRPVGRKSPFAVFIVTIGLFQGLNWLDRALWGDNPRPNPATGDDLATFPSLFPNKPENFHRIGGAVLRYTSLYSLILVLLLTAGLFALFKFTKLGLAMRAVASNAESSKLVGMRTSVVLMFSWGLAAAFAAVGAIVVTSTGTSVYPTLMFTVFIYGSAAATLGGMDSPGGAVIAGLSLGVVQSLLTQWLPNQFEVFDGWLGTNEEVAVAFLVIIVVLLFKPSGLFGTAKVERV